MHCLLGRRSLSARPRCNLRNLGTIKAGRPHKCLNRVCHVEKCNSALLSTFLWRPNSAIVSLIKHDGPSPFTTLVPISLPALPLIGSYIKIFTIHCVSPCCSLSSCTRIVIVVYIPVRKFYLFLIQCASV